MQKIIKLSHGVFKIFWTKNPTETIILNFTPLIKAFNLSQYDNYVLLHWQAKPKNLRRFGAYQPDEYFGIDYQNFSSENINCQLIQIPEDNITTNPVATLLFPNCKLLNFEEQFKLVYINK